MPMVGQRIRQMRQMKKLSQGDIEESTGLLRCYVSRVENGHTVPSLETLERFAAALSVPLYKLFYTGEDAPLTPQLTERKSLEELAEADNGDGAEARFLLKLKGFLAGIKDSDRSVLLNLAKRLATR
ncbi:MAG TPA: helix-turn-helix transcriptional regulator [Terriglobia bacterium]|nr:helix-turn-helix transcriptional regulator [Terriglobia bacterium]